MRLGLPIAFWFMVSFRAERSGVEESLTIIIKGSFDFAQDDTLDKAVFLITFEQMSATKEISPRGLRPWSK